MVQSYRSVLKQAHLYLFLFMLCELAYGGLVANPVLSVVRKCALLLGLSYSILYFGRLPTYVRLVLTLMVGMVIHLCYESLNRYGVWFESVNYVSQLFYPAIVIGSFVACLWVGDVRIERVAGLIVIFYVVNQLVIGKITQHHFNSEDRSMSAAEAYYLLIPMIYCLGVFLLQGKKNYIYYSLGVFVVILLCFHRTVWVTAITAIGVTMYLIRPYAKIKLSTAFLRVIPLVVCALIAIACVLYVKPEITDSMTKSASDIQNANDQGTGAWRAQQRALYMTKVPEHPFFGWTYEGYDQGEVMATIEKEEWIGVKGTFIHSAYVSTLYNFGLIGLLMHFGLMFIATIQFYRVFDRKQPGNWALLGSISTGWIYAWSYQLPEYYWALLGVAIYVTYRTKQMARWRHHAGVNHQPMESELV